MSLRAKRAEATRARLVETALALFAERGYAATSTRAIAQAAGVSEGLIFHHFPNKLELLRAVAANHEVLARQLVVLLQDAQERPCREQLTQLCEAFFTMAGSDKPVARLFRVVLRELLTSPELAQLFRRTSEDVVGALAGYLSARVEAGELPRALHVETAARSLLGSFFWFYITHQHLAARTWRKHASRYSAELVDNWLLLSRVPNAEAQ